MSTPDPVVTVSALNAFELRLKEWLNAGFVRLADSLKLEINGSLDAIIQRLDHLEIEYHMLKAGIVRIEADVAVLKAAYGNVTAIIEDLRGEFAELRSEFLEQRAGLTRLEAEMAVVKAAVGRLEEGQAEERTHRSLLRDEIAPVRHRVDDLEVRVKDLETRLGGR